MKRTTLNFLGTSAFLLAAVVTALMFTGIGVGDVWVAEPHHPGVFAVALALAVTGVACLALRRGGGN